MQITLLQSAILIYQMGVQSLNKTALYLDFLHSIARQGAAYQTEIAPRVGTKTWCFIRGRPVYKSYLSGLQAALHQITIVNTLREA